MNALESLEGARTRSRRRCVLADVELCNLISRKRGVVPDVDFNLQWLAGLQSGRRDLEVAVVEGRIAETVSEPEERLPGEVPVSTVGHRIVLEGRELVERSIECNGQSSAGIVDA